MTYTEVVALLAKACDGGVAKWAEEHEVSDQYVRDVLQGRRKAGPKIFRGLKMRKVVTYEMIEEPGNER